MRNIFSLVNFILLVILLIGGGVYFWYQSQNALISQDVSQKIITENNGYQGQIEYVEGEVEFRRGNSGWKEVQKSDLINDRDEIRTLNNSRAIITFEDGSVLRLDENTSTMMDLKDKKEIGINLEKGNIFNKVAKILDRQYFIKSGDLKFVALGTEFAVEKEDNKSAKLLVLESEVEVQNEKGQKIEKVEEGEKAEIKIGKIEKKDISVQDKQKDFIAWNIKKNIEKRDTQKTQAVKNKLENNEISKKENKKDVSIKNNKPSKYILPPIKNQNKNIVLSASQVGSGIYLKWDVRNFKSEKGFKLVKSTEKNPVYPGNDYKYISNSEKRDYVWSIKDGKGYYFRVCEYLGGKCGVYSNNVFVKAPMNNTNDNNQNGPVKKITLRGDQGDNYVQLNWNVDGYSKKGFKLVRDTKLNPVYPGNDYKYLSNPNTDSYKWVGGYENNQKYYFRVCEYLGGKCGVYSNNVSFVMKNSNNENGTDVKSISINVNQNNDKVVVNWNVDGYSKKGFKVVYSTEPNPVYPGNSYKYISNGDVTSTSWPVSNFEDGETYHFRVCEYLGGKCGVYSKDVILEINNNE